MSIAVECKRKCSRCGNPMIDFVATEDEKKEVVDLLISKKDESDFCVKCITTDELLGLQT